MDISKAIADLKKLPGFTDKVGMVLVHNGVVRAASRDGRPVSRLEVRPDLEAIERIRAEFEARDGIFAVRVVAKSGIFTPGDDLLYIIVAGDIRENVLSAMTDCLNRIKAEAVGKSEQYEVA